MPIHAHTNSHTKSTNPVMWSSVEPYGTHMNAPRIFQHTGAKPCFCLRCTGQGSCQVLCALSGIVLRLPLRIFENHAESPMQIIANLESSKGLITWNVESCGTMWTPSNPRTLNGRRIKSFRRLQAEPVPPKPKAGAASPVLSSGCRRTSENHQTHIDIHRPTQSRR